jgi:hypothetical protein
MKSISAALTIVACAVAGAAFACEDRAMMDDSMAFAQPNASQKPVALAVDTRGAAADKPVAAPKKAANVPDTAVAVPKTAIKQAAVKCTGNDC